MESECGTELSRRLARGNDELMAGSAAVPSITTISATTAFVNVVSWTKLTTELIRFMCGGLVVVHRRALVSAPRR